MKRIETSILIEADPQRVWEVLMDFSKYPDWNPFIRSIEGKAEAGARLHCELSLEAGKTMPIKPIVQEVQPGRHFRWLGHTGRKGIFDGEHAFTLEPTSEGQVRFLHGERFSGILAGIVLFFIGKKTRQGFERMNEALKQEAERGSVD